MRLSKFPTSYNQRETYKLNRVSNEVARYDNVSLLAHPMDSIKRLSFYHGIPLWLHDMDAVCYGEIDPNNPIVNSKLKGER